MLNRKLSPNLVLGCLLLCAQTPIFAADAADATAQAADAVVATEETVTSEAAAHSDTAMDKPAAEQEAAAHSDTAMDEQVAEPAAEEGAEAPQQDTAQVMPHASQPQSIEAPEDEQLRNVYFQFRQRFQSLPVESISDGPYPGLYEIVTDSRVIYVSEDLSLLFQGNIIDLDSGVDLTEARQAGIHMGLINNLGESKMLVYKAEPASDRNITIFTDINCGYCRLLHSEIDTLLTNGVNVRYLMFPRAGIESDSRVALESVWCADDPQAAMTSAKAGEPITPMDCETPVEEHYELAGQVGLRGTPLIYLDNGTALPGYREASVIIQMINSTEPMSN